jgi:hypothetical protein
MTSTLNFSDTRSVIEGLNFESRYPGPTLNAFKSKNRDSMQALCRQSVYQKS